MIQMRGFGTWAGLIFFVIPQIAAPEEPADSGSPCTPQQMYEEIMNTHLKAIERVRDIPETVLRAIGFRDPNDLADPGEQWNSGCVQYEKYPGAALVFAAQTPHYWFIHTKSGGIVLGTHLWIVSSENESPCVRVVQPHFGPHGYPDMQYPYWPSTPERLQQFLKPEWIVPELALWQWRGPDPGTISRYDGLCSGDYRLRIVEGSGIATVSVLKAGDFLRSFEFGSHQQLALSNSLLFVTMFSPTTSGTRVAAFDVESGKQIWEKRLMALRDDKEHSHYRNSGASLTPDGYWLVACGDEEGGRYIEILNQKDGTLSGNLPFSSGERQN